MELTEFVQISKKKEIRFLWDFAEIIAQYPSEVVGSSRANKNLKLEFKEKDSNSLEKKS